MRTVVAVGGNALSREGQAGTGEEQRANALEMARSLRRVLGLGCRVLLTHGNGPQVGNLAIQQGAKVRGAIRFLEAGGSAAIVTSPRRALAALRGAHGTRSVRRRAEVALA